MRLSSLFAPSNQAPVEGSGKDSSSVVEQNLKNGMEEIASKSPGQSVTGEVVERNGNDILIAIGKNQMLRARLDSNVPIDVGQQMSFTIKNMGGSKIVLSPLFANTGNDPNISRALQMAGIPENETSVQMVRTMMQEGMGIDRESLFRMMRAINTNPTADLETVVQLVRLGMPVTENTVFQMEAYKNYDHQITEGLLEIADTLTGTLEEMIAAGDGEESIALFREVLSLLTEAEPENTEKMTDETAQAARELEQEIGKETAETVSQREMPLSEKEMTSLTDGLLRAGMPEEFVKAFASGELSSKELLGRLNELLLKDDLTRAQRESITHLIGGKELNKLVKNEMMEQWLVAPEDVAQNNKMENLYERLNHQMNRFNQALEQMTKTDTPLGKAVSNLSGNIDFMNQLNQMFTYIQIPLKLQGREANGELYVYTNKKNLAKKDGEVSALLHLDMEHLGSVDIHVSMKDSNVSTKFYLRDDSALDLIADHIDILNERLNKRGYSMNASFVKKGEEDSDNVMEEILKQNKNISVLSGYSFDARA
ncbi:MAG: flagellar hook-length control protein FliK [Lachnospiraceae bacterium]|nr:flagellar hook-length control protein FliK [Lachnospiraceae bacterium]